MSYSLCKHIQVHKKFFTSYIYFCLLYLLFLFYLLIHIRDEKCARYEDKQWDDSSFFERSFYRFFASIVSSSTSSTDTHT